MAISTDGWDMIATATQGAINTALNGINAARPTPVSVDKKIPLGGSHLNVTLDANFEALQINALKQGLDIMNIVVTIGDNSTIKIPLVGTQPLDGLQLVLEMALTYVKSDLQPASGTNYDFTIDFTNKAAFQKVSLEVLPGWLSGDLFLVAAIQIVLLEVLEDWAATNPSVTVATVNLGDVSQDFPALVPSQAFYSFNLNESSPDDTPFQVLMLTTGQTQGAFNSTTQYIPTDSNAAALISNNLLMSGILLPAVASGMNAPQSDFSVNSSGQLSMSVDSISFTSDGYTIDVSAFTAEVNSSNQIAISMDASTSVWLGIIDVDMSASANLGFEISSPSSGEQTITLEVQGTPTTKVQPHLPWWLSWAAWILALILPVWGVFAALLTSIINLILAGLGLGASSKISTSFAGFALEQVTWPEADILEINEIDIPSPVQMGVTIGPSSSS